jgi:hypothetical protein
VAKYQSPIAALPDEHMRMVGIISTHWEWVELILERAVAEVMEHDPNRVAALTTNIGFHQKCDLILAHARVFQQNDPPKWRAFTNCIESLRSAYAARNQNIHAKWKMLDGQIYLTEVRTRGGKFTIIDEPWDIQKMNETADQIAAAGEEFVKLMRSLGLLQS